MYKAAAVNKVDNEMYKEAFFVHRSLHEGFKGKDVAVSKHHTVKS
jgi:hypothetical protein